MSALLAPTTTATASTTTRSRIAKIIGFSHPAAADPSSARAPPPPHSDRDDEWYIPYKGPIEPPHHVATRPRGNTFGGLDPGPGAAEDEPKPRPRATSNATRRSYASSSSHSHTRSHSGAGMKTSFFGGGGGGIGEAPVHSAVSTRDRDRDKDRLSTYSARAASTYSTRDRDRDRSSSDWEREREQRGSIASFLTFGQGARRSGTVVLQRPSVSVNTAAAAGGTSYQNSGALWGGSRALLSPGSPTALSPASAGRSTESPAFVFPPVHPHQQQGQGQVRGRRSDDGAVAGLMIQSGAVPARGRAGYPGEAFGHAYTNQKDHAGQPAGTPSNPAGGPDRSWILDSSAPRRKAERERPWYEEDSEDEPQPPYPHPKPQRPAHAPLHTLSHSTSQPILTSHLLPPTHNQSPPHTRQAPHPFAVAFPSVQPTAASGTPKKARSSTYPHPYAHAMANPQTPASHSAPVTTTMNPATMSVSPAAIAAAINTHKLRGSLRANGSGNGGLAAGGTMGAGAPSSGRDHAVKSSCSTPNLRGLFGAGGKGERGAGKSVKMQYMAETWCDALMFPRPRFRAHAISPPASPTGDVAEEERNGWVITGGGDGGRRGAGKMRLKRPATATGAGPRTQSPPRPQPGRAAHASTSAARARTPPRPEHVSTTTPPRSPPRQDFLAADPHASKQQPPSPPKHQPARLSPVEDLLSRVVAEGAQRAEEREKWSELARASFQNRRSRSLSRTRTRKRSVGAAAASERGARIRVESDASSVRVRTCDERATLGLARSVTVGLTTLAAEAFNQPTPTISSMSHSGTAESSNAHSRNTSASLPHGQAQAPAGNTTWGKAALKKLCASEEDMHSDVGVSPREKLEGALMHEKTARLHVRGRKEEAEEADVQFLDIAPLPESSGRNGEESRAHLQSSNASPGALDAPAVGIALSTPTNLCADESGLPDLSRHPYALPLTPRRRAGPVPVAAAYAGPHPTSPKYNMNKHRLPPHVQQQQDAKPLEKRMYAALPSGVVRQVSTPEITQSPVAWDREPERSPPAGPSAYAGANAAGGAYAYANVAASDKRESTLGVEEALMSHAFQRGAGGSAEDHGFGGGGGPGPSREPSSPPVRARPRVRRKPVALASGIPSLSHTVTTAAHTDLPEPELLPPVVRAVSAALSSPSSQGSGSSTTSPRPLGNMDDLEPFRDLFYKPGRPGTESIHRATPSGEFRRTFGARDAFWGDDRMKSDGLRGLTRQLSGESSGFSFPPEVDAGKGENRHTYGQRLDGLEEERMDRRSPSLPGLSDQSVQLNSPLRAEYEEGQDFPEDIESSRASSLIEHESVEGLLRVGTAVSMPVPEPTPSELRQSTALSIGDTDSLQPNTPFTATSRGRIPTTVEDLLRTSFVTTTSSTSRMSNLIGDFPVPPLADMSAVYSASIPPDPTPRGGSPPPLPQPLIAPVSTAEDETTH